MDRLQGHPGLQSKFQGCQGYPHTPKILGTVGYICNSGLRNRQIQGSLATLMSSRSREKLFPKVLEGGGGMGAGWHKKEPLLLLHRTWGLVSKHSGSQFSVSSVPRDLIRISCDLHGLRQAHAAHEHTPHMLHTSTRCTHRHLHTHNIFKREWVDTQLQLLASSCTCIYTPT